MATRKVGSKMGSRVRAKVSRRPASKVVRARPAAQTQTQAQAVTLRCSQCGDPVDAGALLHCEDCLFIYCADHHDGALHLCAVVCQECPADEESD